ncbi:ArsR/SmtB family transcription factor [Glycomyces salinus]|uniref:ArsR/SmtB family transcription factor n=1 Tax=Glycomyces salinus TaxID=980294 RepID=UPI0018EE3C4D|nr:winged helix-turn-helix domain-containing protein [Glycomyces salinus]
MADRGESGPAPDEERPLATEAEAKALASAVRLRIIRLCRDRALTNKELAERLEANPATVLHHVRKLVETGFLEAQDARTGARGAREIPYRSTRKSWTLQYGDRFRANLSTAIMEAYADEVAKVDDPSQVDTSRLGLLLNEEQHRTVVRRLKELLDELEATEPGPGARPYSLFLSVHPDIDRG